MWHVCLLREFTINDFSRFHLYIYIGLGDREENHENAVSVNDKENKRTFKISTELASPYLYKILANKLPSGSTILPIEFHKIRNTPTNEISN
jgi:hypothetical protein